MQELHRTTVSLGVQPLYHANESVRLGSTMCPDIRDTRIAFTTGSVLRTLRH